MTTGSSSQGLEPPSFLVTFPWKKENSEVVISSNFLPSLFIELTLVHGPTVDGV